MLFARNKKKRKEAKDNEKKRKTTKDNERQRKTTKEIILNIKAMENIKFENSLVIAKIINVEGIYTIYLEHAGGPIISDSNLDTAKTKFDKALKLSYAVRNLKYYVEAVKSSDDKMKDLVESLKTTHFPKIDFVQDVVAA